MATIWKSKGTIGEGSTDSGTDIALDVIDERLREFKLFYQGENPGHILPQSHYYEHIVLSVTDVAEPHRPERLTRPGFYLVVGLRVNDAGFLLEPYIFAPFDARPKGQVAHLRVDASVTRDPVSDYMTVDVRFQDAPDRNNLNHSKPVRNAADNETFVDRVVGEFFAKNGLGPVT
jgi:hypothetical protein